MSTENSLESLRSAEYQQRQVVNQLRRDVFSQADPAASEEKMAALQAAEAQLIDLEQKVAEAEGRGPRRSGVLGAESTGLVASIALRMAQVPTSIYHLLDPTKNPLLTCTVKNASGEIRRVRVISYIEGYTARSVDSAELDPGVEESFDMLPTIFPESVKNLNELSRATLNVLIEDLDTGKVEIHRTYPVWMLAHSTAPLAIRDPKSGGWTDMTPYLGAFVTPNAPDVMNFLHEAIKFHPEKRFIGYQVDAKQVEPQLHALFDALKDHDIHYVNSVIDFSPDTGSANQRVRLPRESLANRSANCIDGTVLFASLLEAISLSPAIVIVPGHAFLAWESWSGGTNDWKFLETTMVGSADYPAAAASADKTAQHYQELAKKDPSRFRLHPLRVLRAQYGITPME